MPMKRGHAIHRLRPLAHLTPAGLLQNSAPFRKPATLDEHERFGLFES